MSYSRVYIKIRKKYQVSIKLGGELNGAKAL